jgi:hypothetical protein
MVKEKPQGDLLKEFEDRIFKKNLLTKGEKFIDLVIDYVNLYKLVFDDRDIEHEDEITQNKYQSLMFIMNAEFKASEWKSCVLFYAKKFELDQIYEFLLKIEKVYLAQWVKGMRKDERFSEYSKILRLIEEKRNPSDIINSIHFEPDDISNACNNKNFYGSGYAKYFLLRLELLASEHDAPVDYTAKSIEHVLPQTPKTGSDWEKWNSLDAIEDYVNTVGNLVLLSKGKNSSAKNLNFDVKKEKYLNPRISNYPRSVEVLKETKWDKNIIESRTVDVGKRILQDI